MTTPYIHYEIATGRIVQTGTVPCPEALEIQQPLRDDCAVLAVPELLEPHWDSHYVVDGQIVPRPANPARLLGTQLRAVPVPSQLVIGEEQYAISEPTVDIEIAYPGVYLLRLESFPYLDASFEVTVP